MAANRSKVAHKPAERVTKVELPGDEDGAWLDLSNRLTLCWKPKGGREHRASLITFPDVEVGDSSTDTASGRHDVSGSWSLMQKADGPRHSRMTGRMRWKELFISQLKSGEIKKMRLFGGMTKIARKVSHKLIRVANDDPSLLMDSFDYSGAGIIHCLLLANSEEALELALKLVCKTAMIED